MPLGINREGRGSGRLRVGCRGTEADEDCPPVVGGMKRVGPPDRKERPGGERLRPKDLEFSSAATALGPA